MKNLKRLRKFRVLGLLLILSSICIFAYIPTLMSSVEVGLSGVYMIAALAIGLVILVFGVFMTYIG